MKIRAKAAVSAATIMLVAAGAAGCGGGDDSAGDSPKSASKSEFCGAFKTFETNIGKAATNTDAKAVIKLLKSEAKKLHGVGTPSDITDDERSGYDTVLDAIDDLPDDATAKDLDGLDSSLSSSEKKNSQAFEDYLQKECPDLDSGS